MRAKNKKSMEKYKKERGFRMEKEEMLIKNHHKIIILVNGEEKEVEKEKISYQEVIILAFGNYDSSERTTYTISYFRGENNKPNGVLVKGQEVMVKKGMKFNVSKTNRS